MIKYAICGNIASGKSEAERIISNLGYKVLDTDNVAHELLNLHSNEIIEIFKNFDIKDENKKISRNKLGVIVFNDIKMKEKLENFIHPLVKKEILEFFNNNKEEQKVFVSIPLLFESNMQNLFDKIIFIYAEDNIRLERLISRNNYTCDYAKIRMNSQISQDEKLKKSDIIIRNNSSLEVFEQEIKAAIL